MKQRTRKTDSTFFGLRVGYRGQSLEVYAQDRHGEFKIGWVDSRAELPHMEQYAKDNGWRITRVKTLTLEEKAWLSKAQS